ncbi:uncharacterized protein EI90DRAFT_3022089 [Cantharellus anzutake]|uniref:uncharacterized protein n=1 Tax=Cantharellus anzutake TaxID=1750568 RepID=UPI001903EE46|nr:uncharacterized protein EI90DRAFT_3022089 [Cantharellus anzutake]KAF8315067.1 hypothetical protein EI90DRAFT_3022089 [Cantharellus anzutake]
MPTVSYQRQPQSTTMVDLPKLAIIIYSFGDELSTLADDEIGAFFHMEYVDHPDRLFVARFVMESSWDEDRKSDAHKLHTILPDGRSFDKAIIFYTTHTEANSGTLIAQRWVDGVEYGYDFEQMAEPLEGSARWLRHLHQNTGFSWVIGFTADRVSREVVISQTLNFTYFTTILNQTPRQARLEAFGGQPSILPGNQVVLMEPHETMVLIRGPRYGGLWKEAPHCPNERCPSSITDKPSQDANVSELLRPCLETNIIVDRLGIRSVWFAAQEPWWLLEMDMHGWQHQHWVAPYPFGPWELIPKGQD